MNLKEIQDNAPEGATHYISGYTITTYFKDEDRCLYEWLGESWVFVSLEFVKMITRTMKPIHPARDENEINTQSEHKENIKEKLEDSIRGMDTMFSGINPKYGEYTVTPYNYDATWLDFSSKDGTIETSLIDNQESKDPTNPSHYKQGKVECIDAIDSATVGKKGIEAVLVGNIIKYLWRYEEKNGVEDVEKAKWYLDKLLDIMHK